MSERRVGSADLGALIADRRGERSYEAVARDCGGVLSAARLQQIVTGDLKGYPSPTTIRGLAAGLRVSVTDVVLAASRSLDLDVRIGADPADLTIAGAGVLPAPARHAVETVAREMLALHAGG